MGLSSAGLGSNLPVDSIVSQLMTLEQKPLNQLDKKVTTYQAKLSALGTLKSALSTFQNAVKGLGQVGKFMAMNATASDPATATVTASANAAPGTYSLEVSKLAQAQKLATTGQASTTAPIGAGTLTFDFGTIENGTFDAGSGHYDGAAFTSAGSGTKTVTIDPANTSLAGIRDAINKAGIGVTASIVNDGGTLPHRLVLTQANTGKAGSMQISVAGDAALNTLLGHDPENAAGQALKQTVAAQNAEFRLDGLDISSASNNAANVIEGVTLKLTKTNVGAPASITIARDNAAIVKSVGEYASAYNAVTKTLKDLTAYNEATRTGAVLNGDATARSIQNELRSILLAPVENGSSAFSVLSEVGVTVKGGIMAVDETKLKQVIDTNFNDIAPLFAAVGRPTDSAVTFKASTERTQPGAYDVQITQLAATGKTIGSEIADRSITSGNNTLQVTLDGKSAAVTIPVNDYGDADALAIAVQSAINGNSVFSSAGSSVTVSQVDGKLTLTSNRYGASSGVSISADAAGISLLGPAASTTSGRDIAGTIGGLAATGSGRTLTAGPGAAEGLSLTADALGSRGKINFSHGYAYQFDKFADKLLGTEGPLTLRTAGINASIKQLADSRVRMVDRLADVEKRYRTQYTSLDTTMSKMATTSAYLAQQLAQLGNL